jgi:predicted amidophosphoribosyltransferase
VTGQQPRQTSDVEVTDAKLSVFVSVPAAREDGVCPVCHGPAGERSDGSFYEACYSCNHIPSTGVRLVVPISLVAKNDSQLYTALVEYKSEYVQAYVAEKHRLLLAAALQRFIRQHRACIEGSAGRLWNTITIVPSTWGRPGQHPLESVVRMSPILRRELSTVAEWTGIAVGRNDADPRAFNVLPRARGRSVLIIEDTYTSGAKVQSLAMALHAAGAHVVGAVAVGRVVTTSDPKYPQGGILWNQRRRQRFDFDRCCLE